MSAELTVVESCVSGMRCRRFRTADFKDVIPDMQLMSDGAFRVNPEWESAEYEEFFYDKKKRPLKAKTMYEAFRELNVTHCNPSA